MMGHEGDNSISLKWDTETGQVVRTADPKPEPATALDAEPEADAADPAD